MLEVTAIDVGQGDSLLLVSPQGKTLLIDAGGPIGGSSQAPSGNFEIGEDVVSPVLWSRNIRRLDAVALTHAHSDHMGGMPSVLRNFRPRVLWVGNNPEHPGLRGAPGRGSPARHSRRIHGCRRPLCLRRRAGRSACPAADYIRARPPAMTIRWCSMWPTGKPRCCSKAMPRRPASSRCLARQLHSDLLKVGHHGSKTSTTPRFLAAVAPTYAVISVAHHNPVRPSQNGNPATACRTTMSGPSAPMPWALRPSIWMAAR